MRRILNNFLKYRYFLWELIKRDFQKKYYKSVLGVLWTILNPLLMMAIITIVFSALFDRSIAHYPVYYLTGTLIFNFNREASTQAIYAVTGNAGLIKKIYVPQYFFCLSKAVLALINCLFSLIPLVIVMLVTGAPISWTFALIPIPLFLTLLFTTGLSLALSAAAVYFRDLEHLYGIIMTAWMYLTPLFYPVSIVPAHWRFLWDFNPMAHYVEMMRAVAYAGVLPGLRTVLYACGFSLFSLLAGALVFRKLKGNFFLYF